MISKCFLVILFFCILGMNFAHAVEPTIGGHIKFHAYDYITAEGQTSTQNFKNSQSSGMGCKEFILYIRTALGKKMSLEVAPKFSASTSATPQLGQVLGTQQRNTAMAYGGMQTFLFNIQLSDQYELRLGYFLPKFTWDYGDEAFWEEESHGSRFSVLTAAWHDTGVEIYKNYDISGASLPAYLYILNGNGSDYYDNNRNYTLGLHLEPELLGVRFHASYFAGKCDAAATLSDTRSAVGIEYALGAFSIRSEGVYMKIQKKIMSVTPGDGRVKGYNVKAFYKVYPGIKAMIAYDLADLNYRTVSKVVTDAGGGDIYSEWTFGCNVEVNEFTLLQLQNVMADWRSRDGVDQIKFNRMTAGMRVTF